MEREYTMASPGHPIHTLMEEHKVLLQFAHELKIISNDINKDDYDSGSEKVKHIDHISEHFKESEKHYLREENVLFPFLEKHGITQPPAMMWSEHNQIRERKKEFYDLLDKGRDVDFEEFRNQLAVIAAGIEDLLSSHFHKESNVLFPMALKVFSENEWIDVGKQFDEIGYCCFSPETAGGVTTEEEKLGVKAVSVSEEKIVFGTGDFSEEELESCLNTLPFDLTFVDKDDKVRYYSDGRDRVFVRTKAVIGRTVQLCHPKESVHIVNNILDTFKTGKKDVAAFWIQMNQRLIHIRYFAVRNKEGKYLGTIEVTQDITDLKKIKGEKRLLDWAS